MTVTGSTIISLGVDAACAAAVQAPVGVWQQHLQQQLQMQQLFQMKQAAQAAQAVLWRSLLVNR